MKTILIGGGTVLIVFALLLTFGIIVYSLKENDENIFKYLTIPLIGLVSGIYLLVKGIKMKNN